MSVATLESAVERPLGLRMRGDLTFCPQRFGRQTYWAVKDPVSLKYFHLREEEYRVLAMLDGRASLEEIRRRCEQAFAPRRVTHEQMHGFLANLHRYGLVLADAPGQGEQLREREAEARTKRRFEALLSVLAIRFRGLNPRAFLDWLYPKCAFVFSAWFATCALLLAVTAATLVAVEFRAVQARLPDFATIVGASNLPWLFVALAGIKILHELGHAVACRRFGGDCHEIGVMLLVFTPALYCNVSDAWMIPNKWRRIAIAAAGIYVELILASVCTLLWWFSQPGLFNALCLNTVIVCSVGTLLFNGNPLLRYDGYFILSDLVEVPNLKATASAALRRIAMRVCLGLDTPEDRATPPRRTAPLVLYAIASAVYRVLIVVLVLWALRAMARPYHLETLVVAVAAITVAGIAWPGVQATTRFARDPARRRIAPLRAAATLAAVAALLAGALFIPLPRSVTAPVVLEYRDAQRVYATEPGKLVRFAPIGSLVQAGDVLARLENHEMDLELARLKSDCDRQQRFVSNLEARRLQGDIDGSQIPAATAALADARQRLAQFQQEAARLTIVAPLAGTVLPPPELAREKQPPGTLSSWSGTPLADRNLGSYLERGTLVCLVGDPQRFEAIVHVDENDVELVHAGEEARIKLDHAPGDTYTGTIVEIARLDLDVMPRGLAAAGDLPARTDNSGVTRPLDTWYQARVAFDEDPPRMVARVHGRARIAVASETLAGRTVRWLKQTFAR